MHLATARPSLPIRPATSAPANPEKTHAPSRPANTFTPGRGNRGSRTSSAPILFVLLPLLATITFAAPPHRPLASSNSSARPHTASASASPAAATPLAVSVAFIMTTPPTLTFGQTIDGYAQITLLDPIATDDPGPVTGTITFYDGSATLCTIPVETGTVCPASAGSNLPAGPHSLTAVYSGDPRHAPATSPPVQASILPAVTSTTLISSLSSALAGQNITLTATLQASSTTPTGPVAFLDITSAGTVSLGTAPVSSAGTASLSVAALAPGTHTLSAVYQATPNFKASTSSPLTQIVTASLIPGPSPAFTMTASKISAAAGQPGTSRIIITPVNGFNQPVHLTCADLPFEATCHFSNPDVPATGGTTTLILSTRSPRDCGAALSYDGTSPTAFLNLPAHTPFSHSGVLSAAPILACAIFLMLPRRRYRGPATYWTVLVAFIATAAVLTSTGCGTACTDLGTRPGTYTVQITATSIGPYPTTLAQKVQVTIAP